MISGGVSLLSISGTVGVVLSGPDYDSGGDRREGHAEGVGGVLRGMAGSS